MKVRVLFYRAERDGHAIDDAISLWTKLFNWHTPPYSHCEIWWPTETYPRHFDWKAGRCFTSTMRGDDNGTVIRPASDVLTHPERWDYIEIDVDPIKLAAAIGLAQLFAKQNKGYDILCLLGFFFPWRLRNKKKDICSEVCQKFLVWCGIFPDYKVWSPRRLSARTVEATGCPLKSLAQNEDYT